MDGKFRTDEMIHRVAERFRALGEESRVRILARLMEGEFNVTELSRDLGLGQASVSKHLATLRQVGFVQLRRSGVQSFYSIKDPRLYDLCRNVCEDVIRHHTEIATALQPGGEPQSAARPGKSIRK